MRASKFDKFLKDLGIDLAYLSQDAVWGAHDKTVTLPNGNILEIGWDYDNGTSLFLNGERIG